MSQQDFYRGGQSSQGHSSITNANLNNSNSHSKPHAPHSKIDDAIRLYLKKNGYKETAEKMDLEMKKFQENNSMMGPGGAGSGTGNGSTDASSHPSGSLGEIPAFLLDMYSKEIKEHVTLDEYKLLHDWIANSIDAVKPELLAINFPIFVHTYLFMRKQNNLDANELLEYAGPDFIHDYTEEIHALALFTDYELRLTVTIFVQCAYQKPFRLRMSSVSFNLLKNFLLQNHMLPFLNMIHSGRIVVTIYEPGDPHIYPHFATLDHYHRLAADPISSPSSQVKWGVHGKTSIRTTDINERDIYPDTNDPYYINIIDNLILPNKIFKSGTSPEELQNLTTPSTTTRMPSSPSTGPGSALEPNVIFATLMNTHETMTSLHITKDCKQIVAGFSDSMIRLWTHDREIGNVCQPDESFEDSQSGYHTTAGGGNLTTVLPRAILTPLSSDYYGNGGVGASSSNTSSSSTSATANAAPSSSSASASASSTAPIKFHPTSNSRQTGQKNTNSNGFPYTLELRGHTKRVYSVCHEEYLSTGRIIVSSSGDETIRLWDAYFGQCVAKYYSGEGLTWSVNFSPVGYYFLGTNQCRTASLYCTERSDALRVFRGHTSDVSCSTWHPNLSYFVTGSDDRTARLWDVRSKGETVRCFSPLAPYSSSPSSNSILSSFITSLSPVTSVQISPCGSILAVGYEDSTVVTWDIPQNKITSILIPENIENKKKKRKATTTTTNTTATTTGSNLSLNSKKYSPIYTMAFSSDSNTLITGGHNGMINIYNLHTINYLQIFNQRGVAYYSQSAREVKEPILISPHHSYVTKHTPVYYLNYGTNNLIYGGGGLSLPSY